SSASTTSPPCKGTGLHPPLADIDSHGLDWCKAQIFHLHVFTIGSFVCNFHTNPTDQPSRTLTLFSAIKSLPFLPEKVTKTAVPKVSAIVGSQLLLCSTLPARARFI